jgi:aspartyl-tRNA(Asn)/glutamyl-tRNA(Gln) amidotransferase subunit A
MFRDRNLTRRDALRALGVGTSGLAALSLTGPSQELASPKKIVCSSKQEPNLVTASGIADLVRNRKVSAVEVLEVYLKRIEATNPKLNAFVFVDPESALKMAKSVDDRIHRGQDPGALAGVPLGIKDLDDCMGMPTSFGSLLHKGGPAMAADSPHVARARQAGAIMVGKTATPEFGSSSTTTSKAWGVTRNPWDLTRSPGGSSGGTAAAIAAGMIPLATGSDIGGSIRSPAAFTGLVGLRPSYGRTGLVTPEDRCVVGCLSLSVQDTARFLDVVAGPTPLDRTSLPPAGVRYESLLETLNVTGLRAVWSSDFGFIPTEPECIEVARKAAEVLVTHAKMTWVDRLLDVTDGYKFFFSPLAARLRGEMELDGLWPDKADQLTEELRQELSQVGTFTSVHIARAWRARRELDIQMANLFEHADVLLTPVTTVVSLPAEGPVPDTIAGRDARKTGAEAHLGVVSRSWLPAISVPAGLSSSGFPVGLQIVCPRWRDDLALRLARILEIAQPWPYFAPEYRKRLNRTEGRVAS